MQTDVWLTLKLHSALLFGISFVFYIIFINLFKLFVNQEELDSLLNGEEKELRPIVLIFILNATVFKLIAIATGTTFLALVVKDLL